MRWSCLLLIFSGVVLCPLSAKAIDYSKIDRTLKKEPAYSSKTPYYALLLFGPEAKRRIWVVVDGETVYVDRDADGDLTGNSERFEKYAACKDIEIADPDGKSRYIITAMHDFKEGDLPRPVLVVDVDIRAGVRYRQRCNAMLADTSQKAAIAHFHGPLTIGAEAFSGIVPPRIAKTGLVRGDNPTVHRAIVGTMSAEYGCWVVVRSHTGETSAFPEGVFPVVDVEFPPEKPGGSLVKRRYPLDKFC